MSHIHNITTDGINFDLATILFLCKRRGWQFMENQKTFTWYKNQKQDCEHAIRLPGCDYELGLTSCRDGEGFNVLADFWGDGGLDKILGEQGEIFHEWYNMEKDIAWAENNGYGWEEIETEDMSKKLLIHVNDVANGGW